MRVDFRTNQCYIELTCLRHSEETSTSNVLISAVATTSRVYNAERDLHSPLKKHDCILLCFVL